MTTMTTAAPVSRTARPLAVLSGVAAAVIAWVMIHSVGHVKLEVKNSGKVQTVNLASVIIASLLAGLLAWLVVALLARRAGHPRRTWQILGWLGLLVSLSGPLSLATTSSAKAGLACLHLVTAIILVPSLARTIARR
jgi:xanthosine utilization system XapX-like protein